MASSPAPAQPLAVMPAMDATRRMLVNGSALLGAVMVMIDTTIANVALPHIQAAMSASSEQVVWVLTSYLIASAIATPLSAWLASRFGRKLIMMASIIGFTTASLACGLSQNLPELVVARFIQGAAGAGLGPLSQALLLDLTPPEKHGQAMANFGIAAMFGPLIGPTLGGWLTDSFSWRWCFLINLPLGIVSCLGLGIFMRKRLSRAVENFDLFGFSIVSLFLASLQLMLDRGQQLDWFSSPEIQIEAGVVVMAGWMAAVHTFTASNSFIRPALFTNRTYVLGCLVSAVIGVISFAAVPIVTVMMQQSLGYTAFQTGMISSPRGFGVLTAMVIVGRLIGRFDKRVIVCSGLGVLCIGLTMLSHLPLMVGQSSLMWAGLFQGIGTGMTFVPLSLMVLSPLSSDLRNEGTAIYSLARSIGSSLGISYLQAQSLQNAAHVQSRLVEGLRPDNPMVNYAMPSLDFTDPHSVTMAYGLVVRQATMVANDDTFWLLSVLALAMIPVVLLMRAPRTGAAPPVVLMD